MALYGELKRRNKGFHRFSATPADTYFNPLSQNKIRFSVNKSSNYRITD
jgi:hypothetical protein